MGSECRAMGMSMVLNRGAQSLCYTHPVCLTDQWDLKWGTALQTPGVDGRRFLHTLFYGVLQNIRPFLMSWSSVLLSVAAWMQVALLAGYPRRVVRSTMIFAARKFASVVGYDVGKTEC